MKNKKGLFWLITFMIVFLLSQDYLFVQWSEKPGILGFPIWLGWFAFVHLLFIVVFYWFAKKYWKNS